MTHTLAEMTVSDETFCEIRRLLDDAGYEHAFINEGGRVTLDLTGIALARKEEEMGPGLTLAKIAYEAYCDQTENKSLVTGDELPSWDNLSVGIQAAWFASAAAVARKIFSSIKPSIRR